MSRLKTLVRKVTKSEGLLQPYNKAYDKSTKDFITFGPADMVPSHMVGARSRPRFYIPHIDVIAKAHLLQRCKWYPTCLPTLKAAKI